MANDILQFRGNAVELEDDAFTGLERLPIVWWFTNIIRRIRLTHSVMNHQRVDVFKLVVRQIVDNSTQFLPIV